MKNKHIKSLLPIFLIIILMFSFTACGKSDDGTVDSASTGESYESTPGTNSESDSGTSSPTTSSGTSSVDVYLVDDDTIGIIIRSDESQGLVTSDNGSSGNILFRVDSENSYIQIDGRYGSIGFLPSGTDTYDSYQFDPYQGGTIIAGQNMTYASIYNQGICSKATFEGDYRLVFQNGSNANELTSGDYSSITHKVSKEEFRGILKDAMDSMTVKEPAKAPWDAYFFTDNYSDYTAYLKAEVLKGGLVYLSGEVDGVETDIYGTEESYENASYDYGSYISARLHSVVTGKSIDIDFHKDMYSGQIYYSENDYNDNSGVYKQISMYELSTGKKQAPDNYEDKDPLGLLSETNEGDSKYFKTKSDDYVVSVSSPSSMYYSEQSGDSVPCVAYEIAGFDVNDMLCESYHKYVFENEADAKKVYDFLSTRTYSESAITGKVVYEWYDDTSNYPKKSYLGYDWFTDVHYIYDPNNINGEYVSYKYVSKPYTAEEVEIPIDTLLFFKKLPSGTHYCFESPDATMYLYVDSDNIDISVNDYRNTEDTMLGGGYSSAYRFIDKSDVLSLSYVNGYDNSVGDYRKYVVITEFKINEEKADVIEKRYEVSSFENVDITLDNYESKTPAKTLELSFDMQHVQ